MGVILFLSLACTGVYFEYQSCVLSIALLYMLWSTVWKNGAFVWKKNYLAYCFPGVSLLYLLSAVWAVDSHMAFFGGLKFFPVGLCALLFMQETELREKLLRNLPAAGTLFTLISAAGWAVPLLQEYLWTGTRLAGTFQYPNAFALFLLVCLLYLLHQKEMRGANFAQAAVLLAGILLTGSRTVFLMLPAALLVSGVMVRERRGKILCFGLVGLVGVSVLLLLIIKGELADTRLLELSLSESSLLGRVLYWKDALPVIAQHPLGLGYLGYYFTQGSFQTGVYTVTHVHNEFLQVFLDIGWLAGIGLLGAWIYGLLRADSGWKRLLLIVMGTHALMDFDLQYMAMYMVFLALLPWERGGGLPLTLKRSKAFAAGSLCLSMALCYFGAGIAAYHFQDQSLAGRFYPQNTLLQMETLKLAADAEEMDSIADNILTHNDSVSLAWDAKARAAFAQGDVQLMMNYKEKAISLAKYAREEYEDYLDMLIAAAQWYTQAGDQESAAYCMERALRIPQQLDTVKKATDSLGWRIQDKPELDLPESYQSYLNEIQEQLQ